MPPTDHTQDEHNAQVLRDLWKSIEPFTQGYYVNTEPSAGERRRATYGDNYPKLLELKGKYDPANQFRLNANIRPGGKDSRAKRRSRCCRASSQMRSMAEHVG